MISQRLTLVKKTLVFSLLLGMSMTLVCCHTSEKKVLIKTPYGNMKVRLYNETPQHRDNFIKLVEESFYDSLLFHRVIQGFMIQGGDPDSRQAPEGKQLGNGGPGYTLPAEIIYPQFFHKKGVLAAARQGDQMNPEKRSSGSQFYIVQGKTYSPEGLDSMEVSLADRALQGKMFELITPYQDSLMQMQTRGDQEGFQALIADIREKAENSLAEDDLASMPAGVRDGYTTLGGVPFLDKSYTVFGEVEEGLDVIDKIAAVSTDPYDRPLQNVTMSMEIIEE
jgi:peptidyl-prolyl cis-trans isomerase B (cyclophilin B)